MRKKILIIITGLCVVLVVGCNGDGGVSIEESTGIVLNESSEQVEESIVIEEMAEAVNAKWEKLKKGEPMEINLQAKGDLIGDFIPDGNNIYRATTYHGKLGDVLYCYYFRRYFEKSSSANSEFIFPAELDAVSDDIWEHGMSFWESALESRNSASLDRSGLNINVENKEIVELNGNTFLREEVCAESARTTYTEKTCFVAYYYQTVNGQGVCVFGDRSESQDKFDEVKEVAEAIMSTYRMGE